MDTLITGSLATFGYASKDATRVLEDVMNINSQAVIIGARLVPTCSFPRQWTRQELQQRWGKHYIWRGDWLGNANYATPERGIQIVNAQQGIPWLIRDLEKGLTLILLCACANDTRCHRRVIYELVLERLGNRLPQFIAGERVLTPHGPGRIDPDIPLTIQKMRNRYAILHDISRAGQPRYYFPYELQRYSHSPSLPSLPVIDSFPLTTTA